MLYSQEIVWAKTRVQIIVQCQKLWRRGAEVRVGAHTGIQLWSYYFRILLHGFGP